eukprot:scaffold3716_cov69-Cylindrotheca_fusiformis.AAC.16
MGTQELLSTKSVYWRDSNEMAGGDGERFFAKLTINIIRICGTNKLTSEEPRPEISGYSTGEKWVLQRPPCT